MYVAAVCGRQLPSRWKKRIAWHMTRILVSDTSKKFWIHEDENCRRGRGDLHLDLTFKKKKQKQRTLTVFRQALQIVIVKRVSSFLKTTKKQNVTLFRSEHNYLRGTTFFFFFEICVKVKTITLVEFNLILIKCSWFSGNSAGLGTTSGFQFRTCR